MPRIKPRTMHLEQVVFLIKIEGQVRGLQRMIEDGRYCVDILTQMHSVIGAMKRVETKVFKKHLEGCVSGTMASHSEAEVRQKVDEVIDLIVRFKKG